MEFEQKAISKVFDLGKLCILLFLFMRHEQWNSTHTVNDIEYKRQGPRDSILGTVFGKVRYWRTYLYKVTGTGWYYPLDIELGLPLDGFSMVVRSHAARIATKISYAQSVILLNMFLQ